MGLPSHKQSDNDRLDAEDHKTLLCLFGLVYHNSGLFIRMDDQPSKSFVSLAQIRSESDCKTRRKVMLRNFKILFVVVVIAIISVAAYAFAAANT